MSAYQSLYADIHVVAHIYVPVNTEINLEVVSTHILPKEVFRRLSYNVQKCRLTWVKEVASLTEKGTSSTLARVFANNVFPVQVQS